MTQSGHESTGYSDYAVTTYVPTVGTLINAWQKYRPTSREHARVIVAAVPNPHKWVALPHVLEEVKIVENLVTPSGARMEISLDAMHTDVLASISNATILHMACHGYQDREDPLDSGFVMKDKTLSVLELASLQLSNAFLAFLSACDTAKCSEKQPDEAVHLAATMLFTGVSSVIGTMW